MQHRVKEVTISLEMELGEEFVVFSDDGECVYSSDYMQLLESTFQRVNHIAIMWGRACHLSGSVNDFKGAVARVSSVLLKVL